MIIKLIKFSYLIALLMNALSHFNNCIITLSYSRNSHMLLKQSSRNLYTADVKVYKARENVRGCLGNLMWI